MAEERQENQAGRDPAQSREQRVSVLKDLVAERGYEVPAEDVAARIIRDALMPASPAPRR